SSGWARAPTTCGHSSPTSSLPRSSAREGRQTMPIVSFHQVSKRYPGGFEALKGVSFTVQTGEMLFLTGHSGAGKTTLLKLIAAIERANGGTVLVNGQNVSSMRASAIPYLRRNLGLVFQGQKLLYDRSVFDNVMLPLVVTGQPYREAAR